MALLLSLLSENLLGMVLGTVFTEEKNTAEMLAAANLNNWNVRLEDVEIPNTLTSDKTYSLCC
jgi:hypothetical protein